MSNHTGDDPGAAARLKGNIKWQFIANGLQLILGGSYLLVLGGLLGAEAFGVFSVAASIVAVSAQLFETRMQDLVIKNLAVPADLEGDLRLGQRLVDLAIMETVSRLIPVGLITACSPWIADVFSLGRQGALLLVAAGAALLLSKSANGLATGLLRIYGRSDLVAACLAADLALRLGFVIVLGWWGGLSPLSAMVTSVMAAFIGNCWLIRSALVEVRGRRMDASSRPAGYLLRGWWKRTSDLRGLLMGNLGISVTDLMAKDLDIAIMAFFFGKAQVGAYKMAKSFVQVMWRTIDPVYYSLMPEIQRLWNSDRCADLEGLVRATSRRLLMLSVAVIALSVVGLNLFAGRLLGADYSEIWSLVLLMSSWIVICGPLVWALPLALAAGRPRYAVIGNLLGSLVGAFLLWILSRPLGLIGAGLAWSITLSIGFIFTAMRSQRLLRHRARLAALA